MVTAEQAAHMTEREIFKMIFLPGFSTAEKRSKVSGRGVGMDVVKTNVERIGGNVDVQSAAGRGTTVRVKIPLTLAIIPALVVTSGGDRYAIPQVSLLELVRIEAEEVAKSIESVHGAPVYRLRGRLLPLVYLNRELNTGGLHRQAAGHTSTESGSKWEMLDFSQARVKHQHWLARLREVLDNKVAAQDPWTKLIGPRLTDEPYGLAISRQHPDFVRFVNAVLAQLRTNGRWAASYAHWIGTPVPAPPPAQYGG